MTKEEKDQLIVALCGYLPYGVRCKLPHADGYKCENVCIDNDEFCAYFPDFDKFESIEGIKLYLRSMSSMTEDEKSEYNDLVKNTINFYNCPKSEIICFFSIPVDWLNKHHFDYRGLIERGLALEAPEKLYGRLI